MRVAPCGHAPGGDVVLGGNLGGGESGLSRRGFKRIRLSRKSAAVEAFQGVLRDRARPRVWKRLRIGASPLESGDDAGRRQLHGHLLVGAPVRPGQGWGLLISHWSCADPRLYVCIVFFFTLQVHAVGVEW